MPKDYYTGDKELYVKALADGKDMFTVDGVMPDEGPETVLKVLTLSNKALETKKVDLSKTYTTEFVKAAK
jgi:NitT/TauT family transport system substrate-binding protein